MELINNNSNFIEVNGVLLKRSAIQLLKIDKDAESLGAKEHLYISTGLASGKIYGKKEIKKFLATNFPKGTINEILVR